MSSIPKVYVCQAGSCRRAGSEAVLLEIEELIQGTKGVCVEASGCLGLCSQAPNAMTVTDTSELMFTELRDLSSTVALVERVNGSIPRIDSTKMTRLEKARRLRLRMQAREESKWNLALSGVAEDLKCACSDEDRLELIQDQANVLAAAGLGEEALEAMDRILKEYVLNFQNIPMLRLVLDKASYCHALVKTRSSQDYERVLISCGLVDSRVILRPKSSVFLNKIKQLMQMFMQVSVFKIMQNGT